ncbi:AAA family ATPase [Vibrio viridaestus]|uniref:AAA family ATPase n=1 Tax=Vibrio viridaestus TaxID=2487322 RepID=A0A3N9TGA5_9VIBR|nr:AAA family ATPase [Vibrio viridaestus]RQW63020.1 AAA family ATPase [Vibrio viridaestus]
MNRQDHQHLTELMPQALAPKVPTSFSELNVPRTVMENLLLKQLSAYPKSDLLTLTKLMAISSHMIEELLGDLRRRSLIEVFQPDSRDTHISGAVLYALSKEGIQEAEYAFRKDAYLGQAPVNLSDYFAMVQSQDIREKHIQRDEVVFALNDVFGAERLISVLGPAINSGRALLLYGDAGTGKTYVATRLLRSLNTSVYVPYAVFAAGNIIRIFSAQHHKKVNQVELSSAYLKDKHDPRWALCERPSIQVGGELTMDMLEVNHTEHNRVWLAPVQMMANNGILIIDDLGRQSMPVAKLLNRWIVPMEYQYDYLTLPNGQQISVPFVLTLAFSTNLDPEKIGDPAFLRRLGYKIQFEPLRKDEYQALWELTADVKTLNIPEETFQTLYQLHEKNGMGFYPCLPKDLIGISRDILVFEDANPTITPDVLQQAWHVYFTKDGNGGR